MCVYLFYQGVMQPGASSPAEEGGVYACLVMPSLILGTVGGGTGLATQRECLQLMGCHGTVSRGRRVEGWGWAKIGSLMVEEVGLGSLMVEGVGLGSFMVEGVGLGSLMVEGWG